MYKPKSPYASLAIDAIMAIVNNQDIEVIKSRKIPEEFDKHLACFVSIHLKDGSLRGCIGTIEPREENLHYEIISNAIAASTRDSRFLPISKSELENLEVSVDILSKPFLIEDTKQLNPTKFGIIVTDDAFAKGVLLPDIDGVETIEKQISIAKRKAGLSDYKLDKLKIYAFTSTRYH